MVAIDSSFTTAAFTGDGRGQYGGEADDEGIKPVQFAAPGLW